MSGHNKWSQIKEKKGKTDAKKSQVFGKLAKLISAEARKAKGNKEAPGLRAALVQARSVNMPNDNIDRAIKKATEGGGTEMESILYEGYGPGGVALLIDILTDSRNRASGEIKHLLADNGGNLASPGAASWAFEKTVEGWKAVTTVELEDADLEKLDKLVEILEANEDVQKVITNAE